MMKRTPMLFLALVYCVDLLSQDKPQYDVNLIADSLKKDVNSVIREQRIQLVLKKPGKGKQTVSKSVTVLNEKGKNELFFYEYFDKFRKIEDVEISIYDNKGKFIRRSRKKDLQQEAVGDGISIVGDDKIIYTRIRPDNFPVTIETKYEIVYDGMLEYDDFYPQETDQSIQYTSHSITTTPDNKVRYKNYRTDIKPKIIETAGTITYSWETRNVMGFERETGSATRDVPHVKISPTLFEMDDYAGDMSSWESFGKWQIALTSQTNRLPEERANFYRNMVKDARSDKEKIKILYDYLQQNFRYVSIQLGIGGWKPFPANFVDSKKYGDCKALSNFMQAMLNAVNIKSHYAIINAGNYQMPADMSFPYLFSNHIILCVPLSKDTVWLECTSRTQPFGKLGAFTENRNAFLITDNGGVIVATPKSNPEDNKISTFTYVALNSDGSGDAKISIAHSGEFTDLISHYLFEGTEAEQKALIFNNAGFKQSAEFILKTTRGVPRNTPVDLELKYEKVHDFSTGSKYFLGPRMYKFWDEALPKYENRKTDYYLDFAQIQEDSTVYKLPDDYMPENIPKSSVIKYALGFYEANYRFDEPNNQIITTCRIKLDRNIIPPDKYSEASQFFNSVIKEQKQKIIIKKKE